MANKLMYIPNDDKQNYFSLCRFQLVDTQLNEQTNQNLNKIPQGFKPSN